MSLELAKARVKEKIKNYLRTEYGGSCDIEVSDSLDFCTYFNLKYNDKMEELQRTLIRFEEKIKILTGWNPGPPQELVLPANPDDPPELTVAPWQLGITVAHSVKGKSKGIHIMDTVHNFLERPYNSKKEPLDMLFAPGAREGEVIGSWSMVHSIGMGKSSACRMILEAACVLNLTDEELQSTASVFKALLRMRAIYDPAETEELQLLKAMGGKAMLTDRPRPDPLMWANRWSRVIVAQGSVFAEVIAAKIKEYNKDKTDGCTISRDEEAIITFLPAQSQEFLNLLEYHWQNFKVQESAVNIKRLSTKDLNPVLRNATRTSRCPKENILWMDILKWSQEKCHYWLMREVGTFAKNIKEAVRANKKINLRGNSREFRGDLSTTSYDEVCIFVHFLDEFKHHTTPVQFEQLVARFSRGMLNRELSDKAKAMNPAMKGTDFRFIQYITGESPGPRSGSTGTEEEAQAKAEEAELNVVEMKLLREREAWQDYQRSLQAHHAKSHEDKKEVNAAFTSKLNDKAEEFCNIITPTRRLHEEAVQTYIQESMAAWCEHEGVSMERAHTVFIVRFDALGTYFYPNAAPAIRLVVDHLAMSPKSCALFLGPNTSKPGDCYNEDNIRKSVEDMDMALRDDELPLRVSRCNIILSDESLGGQRSKRPGWHTCWLVMSSSTDENGKLSCAFENCYLQQRRRTEASLHALNRTQWINPCAALSRTSGGSTLSKAQRSKQWFTGPAFWTDLCHSILTWSSVGPKDVVAWVDLLPYDDKLQHSILTSRSTSRSNLPAQAVIAPIWAKMSFDNAAEKVDNSRIESFIKKSCRRHTCSLVRSGSLVLDGLDIRDLDVKGSTPPTYDEKSYKLTCPNTANHLPVRQDWLDSIQERIKSHTARLQDMIKEHDKLANPSGVPYKGEKKRTAEESPKVDAVEYEPEADGPKSKDEFTNEQSLEGLTSEHQFFIKDGILWLHAHVDQIIPATEPLMLLWGEYMCGAEKSKEMARSKTKSIPWNMTSATYRAAFSVLGPGPGPSSGADSALTFPSAPTTLGKFLYFLEEKNYSGFSIECHKLEDTLDGSSAPESYFKVECSEECIYVPKPLQAKMAKMKCKKDSAGSLLDFEEWDFPAMSHSLGRVELVMQLQFVVDDANIVPLKPGIFLKSAIKVKQGQFIRLA